MKKHQNKPLIQEEEDIIIEREEKNRRERKKRHRLDRFTSEEYAKWRKYNESKQINTGYDESNISPQQQEVLNDAVATRAGLSCDPLHSDCPKSN